MPDHVGHDVLTGDQMPDHVGHDVITVIPLPYRHPRLDRGSIKFVEYLSNKYKFQLTLYDTLKK